jgi:hypothetical protein
LKFSFLFRVLNFFRGWRINCQSKAKHFCISVHPSLGSFGRDDERRKGFASSLEQKERWDSCERLHKANGWPHGSVQMSFLSPFSGRKKKAREEGAYSANLCVQANHKFPICFWPAAPAIKVRFLGTDFCHSPLRCDAERFRSPARLDGCMLRNQARHIFSFFYYNITFSCSVQFFFLSLIVVVVDCSVPNQAQKSSQRDAEREEKSEERNIGRAGKL